jgi:signal transduction histidine kinase
LRVYRLAQQANVELQEQVLRKRRELEEKFARVQELERQRAVIEERDRLTREMHDGLGGQLVSMLAVSERGDVSRAELSQALREALDEMRLVLQSLDLGCRDITALLAGLRARLEPRLRCQGLRFRWAVADIAMPETMGPSEALQILRIVQESVTNILKHASAKEVTIRTGIAEVLDAREMFVEVADDGMGIAAALPSAGGRGMNHMSDRARRIGGRLTFRSDPRGTTVRLSIPLGGLS